MTETTPSPRQSMHKAVVALLSGAVTILAAFGLDLTEYGIGTEVITGIGAVVTTLLVYLVPNKPVAENADSTGTE